MHGRPYTCLHSFKLTSSVSRERLPYAIQLGLHITFIAWNLNLAPPPLNEIYKWCVLASLVQYTDQLVISPETITIINYLAHVLQEWLSFCTPHITLQQPMGHILNLPWLTLPTPSLLSRQPSSTFNQGGAVPPLNIIIIHLRVLLATSKHCDSIYTLYFY